MKLIEGVDYRVRYVEFPNTGSPSVAVSNGDGTYTVYVNTRFSIEEQARGLRHELEHLDGHLYTEHIDRFLTDEEVVAYYREQGYDIEELPEESGEKA